MTFDENEIRRRLRLGQDSHWEFEEFEFRGDRPARPDGQSIADELAAFANARGGAMLCGVTDAGEVHGMTRRQLDALEQLVVNLCTDSVKPPIEIDTPGERSTASRFSSWRSLPVMLCTKVRGAHFAVWAVPSGG